MQDEPPLTAVRLAYLLAKTGLPLSAYRSFRALRLFLYLFQKISFRCGLFSRRFSPYLTESGPDI
jgi:hypothetical protein